MSLKCLNVHNYARILTLMRCIKFRTLIKVLSSKYMQGKAISCAISMTNVPQQESVYIGIFDIEYADGYLNDHITNT